MTTVEQRGEESTDRQILPDVWLRGKGKDQRYAEIVLPKSIVRETTDTAALQALSALWVKACELKTGTRAGVAMRLTLEELGVIFLPILSEVFETAVNAAVHYNSLPHKDRTRLLPDVREAASLIADGNFSVSTESTPQSD